MGQVLADCIIGLYLTIIFNDCVIFVLGYPENYARAIKCFGNRLCFDDDVFKIAPLIYTSVISKPFNIPTSKVKKLKKALRYEINFLL